MPHQEAMPKNLLYYSDNLSILQNPEYFSPASIDLIYLDPPFNSNKKYNVLFTEQDSSRSAAQIQAFDDTWKWNASAARSFQGILDAGGKSAEALTALRALVGESDMLAYLTMMVPRLVEMRRVLKPTGSIYLHCDPTASHYLKCLMDSIFGPGKFLNEVIWHYRKWPTGKYTFQSNHDVILFYGGGSDQTRTFNQLYMERAPSTLKRFGTSKIVSGHDDSGKRLPSTTQEEDSQGVRLDDVWDIGRVPPIKQLFPTEKPLPLLRRIIEASSRPGDTVLDPFCGCGTTVVAAQELGRRWIGIDITHLAITLTRTRLRDTYGNQVSYEVKGEPTDVAGARDLATKQSHYQFQWWALGMIGARPVQEERKKGADSGIDGKIFFRESDNGPVRTMVIQVKSGKLTLSAVRDFNGVIEREKARLGVLLTLDEPTKDMRAEAIGLGTYKPDGLLDVRHARCQILTIQQLLNGEEPKYTKYQNLTLKAAPVNVQPLKEQSGKTKRLTEF